MRFSRDGVGRVVVPVRLVVAAATSAALALLATAALASKPVDTAMPSSATTAEIEVPNGSFEELDDQGWAADWTLDPPPRAQSASVVETDAHEGARSLEVVDPPAGQVAVRSSRLDVVPGAAYEATAWMRTAGGVSAWLYLEFFDAGGARLAETHVVPAASAAWQQAAVEGSAPATAASMDLLIYGSSGTEGTTYVDDVALRTLSTVPPYDPVIGVERQLFHDLDRVGSLAHVGMAVHEAEVSDQPLIVADQPWESNNVYLYGTAIFDREKGLFKLWYHVYNWELGEYLNLYATSKDGEEWDKPDLGLYDYQGSTANNVFMGNGIHSPTVIKDSFEDDPERLYKMMAMDYGSGYTVFFSPDGIHWTGCDCNPVSTGADVANVFQDPETGEFGVTWKQPDLRPVPGRRVAFLSTSEDFETWTEPELVLAADERDQQMAVADGHDNAQIYGMPVVPYEGTYVGFPWIYKPGGSTVGMPGSGPVDVQLAFSDDLHTWTRDDRTTVIPRGAPGSWDAGMIYTSSNLIRVRDELRLFYSGWDGFHDGAAGRGASIGVATWRVDGFASLTNGGDAAGTVTTKPLVFEGSRLSVNAAIERGGSLRAELLDAQGQPIPGFTVDESRPLTKDRVAHEMRWDGDPDLGALAGTEVRVRFHLDGGDLYSYGFED